MIYLYLFMIGLCSFTAGLDVASGRRLVAMLNIVLALYLGVSLVGQIYR
jgi:hypothetical protein